MAGMACARTLLRLGIRPLLVAPMQDVAIRGETLSFRASPYLATLGWLDLLDSETSLVSEGRYSVWGGGALRRSVSHQEEMSGWHLDRQRLEEGCVHEGEDRAGRPDGEAQREDAGQGDARAPEQGARGTAKGKVDLAQMALSMLVDLFGADAQAAFMSVNLDGPVGSPKPSFSGGGAAPSASGIPGLNIPGVSLPGLGGSTDTSAPGAAPATGIGGTAGSAVGGAVGGAGGAAVGGAAGGLLNDLIGRLVLRAYFDRYVLMATEAGAGFILESPTWRANSDWGKKLGYGAEALQRVNRAAIEMMGLARI